MTWTTGRGGLALVVAAVLTGVAACTSSGGPPEERRAAPATLAALRAAERATERAASAHVRSTTAIGSQLALEADGALGWADGLTGTLTITYTGGTTAESLRALGITSMEARYLPDAYYARMGDSFARKAGGKHWIKYGYADLEALGGGANFADQMRNTTPDQSVRLLLDTDDVRKVGEEKIGGRITTHYSGTVEVAEVADARLRKQLQQAGVSSETVDIWVDDRGLLVKKAEKGRTTAGELTQTAHYGDYGTDVSVAVPPASDTADFSELLGKEPAG